MSIMNTNIEALKKRFLCSDWNDLLIISNELMSIGGDSVLFFFIECLGSKNDKIRNAAALSLRDLSDNRSTVHLFEGVLNPIDPNRCGTIAYALETHDCSYDFLNVFRILFYSNYECKWSAHNILNEQEFLFSEDDLLEVKRMWEECLLTPTLCPAFADSKEGIQDDVDSYLDYLTD
ncbi:hypothetical protein BCT69_01940 [Enterovibrio norvegicus]|nr:hypothetical protein BCT69_01940 [Enterovibrio norvegicus]